VSVSINGLHVSESMAQLQEGILPGEFDKLGVEYTTLPLITAIRWNEQRGAIRALDMLQIANTCLALADLALFSPIGAVYGILRTPDQSWLDLHPGFRFVRALNAVCELDAWLTDLEETEELANRVCDHLGWIRPSCFLKVGADLNFDQFMAHRDACRIRLGNFSAFLLLRRNGGGAWIPDFLDNHMPITAHPNQGVVCPLPNNEPHAAVARLRDCCLARLCWKAMGSSDPIAVAGLFPEDFPYTRHFDEPYDNPTNFYALFVQKRPWAAIERFQLHEQ
jgi:hypothetical protein